MLYFTVTKTGFDWQKIETRFDSVAKNCCQNPHSC